METKKKPPHASSNSLSPKQAALLSALPLALSRLGRTTARIPSATGALSAATSAAVRALTSAGAAAATAAAAERGMGSSSSSTLSFISACQSAEEFASALPAVAEAWRTGGAAERGSARGEGEAGEYARSLLASSLLRLLPAACLPFAPLRPPSPSAVELLKPQTVSALGRGEERALGSSERKRASGAAGGVAVAIVSALCSLSPPSSGDGSEPAPPPSFGNSWGFSVETSALPPKKKKEEKKKKKGVGSDDGDGGNDSDSGDEDSDKEEEEEEEEGGGEEQEAAAVGRTPSALSLALATYASAWCSFERSDESGATEKRGRLSLSLSAASASAAVAASTTSSRSLSAAAASVPALLEAAFARRSPGLVVAAAQLASVSASAAAATAATAAAAAAGATAAEGAASEAAAPSAAPPRPSCEAARRLLPHLSRAMSFTPSSAARNACYEAWEATLRAMPAAERAAECARLADEAAAAPPPPSPSGRPSAPVPSPPSSPPPNAALEALALHHLSSMVASSWPTPPPSSPAAAGGERGEPCGGGPAPAAAATAAALLASAATARVFPLGPRPLGWGGSEVSLLERVEPVAASLAALRLLLLRGRAAAPLPPSLASGLPAPLAALVSDGEAQRRWRRRTLVSEALLPLRAAACSAAQGLRAAAGEAGKECAGGGSEAGLAVERLLDALARVLELAEA